jgi:site-specific recombinase XerD
VQLLGTADARPLILGAMADYEITKKETGLIVYDGGLTKHLIERFVVAKKVAGCTDRTCKLYYSNLTRTFAIIGKDPLQMTHTDFQAVIAGLIVKGVSKAYQQNIMRTFSSFYSWLTREEIVSKNPMLKIDPIKARAKHKEAFTDMDVEKIRMACETRRETALVELLLSTGLRIFEAAKLTRKDAEGERIKVIGKGEKERYVYMTARAQLAMRTYLEQRRDENPYVFPASKFVGMKVTEINLGSIFRCSKAKREWYVEHPELVSVDAHSGNDVLEAMIRNIGKRAGVSNCHPHRFRRTCATMALRRGMDVTLVQKMLGHDSLATTQMYLDIGNEDLQTAHKKYVI